MCMYICKLCFSRGSQGRIAYKLIVNQCINKKKPAMPVIHYFSASAHQNSAKR